MNKLTDLEQQALEVGNNPQALKKRLLEARSCLIKKFRDEFTPYTFEPENKRLVSKSGTFFLQWMIRTYPDMPISYENQQTSKGCVFVLRASKKH